MMISPESFYSEHLEGKDVGQIMTVIRRIKREIEKLKNTMENPTLVHELLVEPSLSTRLWSNRLYLERAKEALVEAGGVYVPSRAEMKAAAFEDSIPSTCKLVFSIGGFSSGYETRTYSFDNERVCVEASFGYEITDYNVELPYELTKSEFLDGLKELRIGEWRSQYDLLRFHCDVCDGTQWELEIHFANGHKTVKICGDNAYPYNFREFQELLGMEPYEENEDEEKAVIESKQLSEST